ncbi:MAG: hypothetical protein KJ065_11820 [Anaerolineae bacterium]|nr:hypothetical protein [Anaerolineae bacterium]
MATTYIFTETIYEPAPSLYELLVANLSNRANSVFGRVWDVVQVDAITMPDGARAMQVIGYTNKLYGTTFGDTARYVLFQVTLADIGAQETQVRFIVSHPVGDFHPDHPQTLANARMYNRCVKIGGMLREFCLKPPSPGIDEQIAGYLKRVMSGDKNKRKRE